MAKPTKKDKEKEYQLALEQTYNESHIVWQYSNGFVLADTVVFTFVVTTLDKPPGVASLLLAAGGLIISMVWLGHSERRWGWYQFRMAQARMIEGFTNFNLVGHNTGERFSSGECVEIAGKHYQLNLLARMFKTQMSNRIFVLLFIIFYFIMALRSGIFLLIT